MRQTGDVLERLGNVDSFDGLEGAIVGLRETFDVEHVVYHFVKTSGDRWGAVTYKKDWVETYIEEDFQTIDPVVLSCFNKFTPADWKGMDWSGRQARMLMAEGVAHGVGNQGVTLPLRGPGGQFAVLTLNDQTNDDNWARFTRGVLNDLLLVGHYVNERAIALEGRRDVPIQALSPREADSLTLLASGLGRAQVAERLRISENTLRVYIEGARFKLNANNTVHAVATAMSRGMICI
ncbi:MAG: autoinducer binding domain-containing protein [Pseudomonadota bacterium]